MIAWRRPRTTARVATTMLFVWLFAIVASWANACVLEPRSGRAHAAADHAVVLAMGSGHATDDADHGDPGRTACLDLCDDEQGAIPKTGTTSVPDLVAIPMIASALWSFAVIETTYPRERPLAAAPPPERPVAIRFLRLTI